MSDDRTLPVRFVGAEQVALHERLRRRAFDEDRPMAELVREALERFLAPESRSTGRPVVPTHPATDGLQAAADATVERYLSGEAEKAERMAAAEAAQTGDCEHKSTRIGAGGMKFCNECQALLKR